jgi:hypothetical protein
MYLVNQVKSSFTYSFPSEPYAPLGLPVPFVGPGASSKKLRALARVTTKRLGAECNDFWVSR